MLNSDVKIGTVYTHEGRYARSFKDRLKGLSLVDKDEVREPLMFENCKTIHTFGMRFDLFVIFLDRDSHILTTKKVVPKRMVWGPKNTHSIVECVFQE